jgi:hypothetical protein
VDGCEGFCLLLSNQRVRGLFVGGTKIACLGHIDFLLGFVVLG